MRCFQVCTLLLLAVFGRAGVGTAAAPNPYVARLEALRQENAREPLQLDRFGGWVNAPEALGKPEPGDYFRVAKRNGAWWFFTPQGHPFVSKAVTDVNWLGAMLSDGPHHDIIVKKYGTEADWGQSALQRLIDWGFNSVGPWSSASMTSRLPHAIIILDSAGHSPRPPKTVVTDYWSPEFAEHSVTVAQQRAGPYVTDKNLIGYFLDNELVWGSDHFLTKKPLLQLYAEFPAGSPGRGESLRFARESAGTVDAFNATWKTAITDWAQLEMLPPKTFGAKNDQALAVIEKFKLHVFHQYAKIAIAGLRSVDPNHLILGCRFHNYPGDSLIRVAADYFDVISMAFYEPRPPVQEIDKIWKEVDKPFLIEEWTFESMDSGLLNINIYAPRVKTQQDRSLAYASYVETFMRRPYAIGYHWYKWMDNPRKPKEPFSGDNCGLLNHEDEPYVPFLTFVKEVNRRVEAWHAEGDTTESAVQPSR